jgi:hypothetical protein
MKIQKRNWLKLLFGVIGTIVLGAIGSGLWEVFLSDFFFNSINLFLRMSSYIFKGYVDILHKNICNGSSEIFSFFPYILVVVAICSFPWMALFMSRDRWGNLEKKITGKGKSDKPLTSDEILEEVLKHKKRFTYAYAFGGTLLFCLIFTTAASDVYQYKASLFIEKSIEIVSPNLTQKEILNLRSLYRSINDSRKFYSLEKKLHEIANSNNLELPDFSSIK